jgi:glycosyltransferase involved in cell wall biosynthesis
MEGLGFMLQRKLLIVPGTCDALGGTLVTLSLLIQGFVEQGRADSIKVVVKAGSFMERYLGAAGHEAVLKVVSGQGKRDFLGNALAWVAQQPLEWPLLLDNCVERSLLPTLIFAAPKLRLSGRPVYHFCHDLALSYNALGYWSRKLAFGLLNPRALCNSYYTRSHVRTFVPNVAGVLYQPVDLEKFTPRLRSQTQPPPSALLSAIASGARIMLTPSRINLAGIVNDKNLRGLIPVLAELKQRGALYHGVVIGEDRSLGQSNSRALMEEAERLNVADRFTILPPTFEIEDFYRFADVVVSLAPREPFGRVVVEAIACGVPVIGSQTGGIGEILSHITTRWMVEIDNSVAIAQAIIDVVNDPQTSEFLLRGQKWVEEHCNLRTYANKILKLTEMESLSPILSTSFPSINKAI